MDYFSYVSELRNNIFLAETGTLSLRIFSVTKEYPYAADGVPMETSTRTEFFLLAPSADKNCQLAFTIEGKEYGGEMSYDNVKAEYYFSCTLDVSTFGEIKCVVTYGEEQTQLNALSVLDESTLSPSAVLTGLLTQEKSLFESMTDEYGFTGEIYLRLIYEDNPYYYVGIINRDGKTHAFLISAKSGKILARRES